MPKTQFVSIVKIYAKRNNRKWTDKTIQKAVDKILDEEKRNPVLSHIDDGSRPDPSIGKEFVFDVNSETQNLFSCMEHFIL